MMKQITVNIPESDYRTVLQFLGTFDAVEIVGNTSDTTLAISENGASQIREKRLKSGIDNTPFDRHELRKNHRLTLENVIELRKLFKGAPFDEMEKLLTK